MVPPGYEAGTDKTAVDDALKDMTWDNAADRAIARMRSPKDMHIICALALSKNALRRSRSLPQVLKRLAPISLQPGQSTMPP